MKLKPLYYGISVAFLLGAGSAAYADPGTMDQPQSATVGTAIDDAAITTKVKSKYMGDSRLKDADISVTTANGVVMLKGSAPSAEAKSTAETLAKSVEGVSSVDNDLMTPSATSSMEKKSKHAARKTKRVMSDSWITTKVKSTLLADDVTKGFEISVKTIHHVVILSGTVDTQAAADHAEKLAKQVDGVSSVDSDNLKVSSN